MKIIYASFKSGPIFKSRLNFMMKSHPIICLWLGGARHGRSVSVAAAAGAMFYNTIQAKPSAGFYLSEGGQRQREIGSPLLQRTIVYAHSAVPEQAQGQRHNARRDTSPAVKNNGRCAVHACQNLAQQGWGRIAARIVNQGPRRQV